MEKLSRRNFLRASVVTVVGAAVAACSQPAPEPTKPAAAATAAPTKPAAAQPTAAPKLKEAPMLAELVKAGKLPPVEERLPADPMIIPIEEEIGVYGGTLRRFFIGPSDGSNWGRVVRGGFLCWNKANTQVIPQVAKSWQISQDLKTYTFSLRKGMKWSDGAPYTADDIMFWWNDMQLNTEMTAAPAAWMTVGGARGNIEKVDDYTVKFVFGGPYPLILEWLTGGGGGEIGAPKHYVSQFHINYAKDKDALLKMAADAKFDKWFQLFANKNSYATNADRPTIYAWAPDKSTAADKRYTWTRNPYCYFVDPQGNQLPYIDTIVYDFADNADVVNLKVIAGEADLQERHTNLVNYPVFMKEKEKGDYRVLLWPDPCGGDASLMFNQNYVMKDPLVGEWLANKDFRIALSYALNRDEILQSAFLGLGVPRQLCVEDASPFFPSKEWANKYIEYDVKKANDMLDKLLPKKGADGMRLRPDGQVLSLVIDAINAFGPWPDVGQLAVRDWAKVGVKATVSVIERSLYYTRLNANEQQIAIWNVGGAEHMFIYPYWTSAYSNSSRIGPVNGLWWTSGGKSGVEPTGNLKKVMDLTEKGKTVSEAERAELGKEIIRINCEEIWSIGTVGLSPMVQGVVVAKNKLRNVPEKLSNSVVPLSPGNAFPEQWFWKK
jgi:peptide/nickel transport system substrate-binding protein